MGIILVQSAEIDWFQLYSRYGQSFDSRFNLAADELIESPELGPPYLVKPIRRMILRKSP
jgi:hypothetical protein